MMNFGKMSFLLICFFSTVLLASLLIPCSPLHLRKSTFLHRLWITSQLIVLIIWKISPAKSDANRPQHPTELDLPPGVVDPPPPELSWYSAPSDEPPLEEAQKEVAIATERPSMDDTWEAIVAERGKRVLRKSETWERRGRAERAAAAALRRSDTVAPPVLPQTAKGWRRREKLVESQEELLQRVETFIKKHYDHLRLQKQESERRRFLERQLLRH